MQFNTFFLDKTTNALFAFHYSKATEKKTIRKIHDDGLATPECPEEIHYRSTGEKAQKNASLKWKSINFSLFYSPDLLPCRSHSIIMETTEENLLENRYCRLLGLCTILCQCFLRHLPPRFNIIQLFMRALDALESGLTSTNWRLKRSSRDVRESRTELFAMQCWESSVSMLWCLLIETEIRNHLLILNCE